MEEKKTNDSYDLYAAVVVGNRKAVLIDNFSLSDASTELLCMQCKSIPYDPLVCGNCSGFLCRNDYNYLSCIDLALCHRCNSS